MSTFRKKILITHLIVFLVFLGLMFPFASQSMQRILTKAMTDRADELIAKIEAAPSEEAMARRLKNQEHLTFFRVTLISEDHRTIYDSHTKLMMGPRFTQEYIVDHPDVVQAFSQGIGYSENYSDLLGQKFAYLSKAFKFQGSTYVIRTAFPQKYLEELNRNFTLGFLFLSALVLLAFSILSWLIIYRLTQPIQQITDAIKPYHEGTADAIPEIRVKNADAKDDFSQLASTLNSLSRRVQRQIDSLKKERNEKGAILESLSEAVIAVDADMVITYANRQALDMLGLTEEEVAGSRFSVTRLPQCQDLLRQSLESSEPQVLSIEMRTDQQRLFLDAVAVPNGPDNGAILVLHDTTAQRKMLEMRKDFIANASHELKTPITIIRGFAETLHENPDLTPETYREITEKIVMSCERMSLLVRDLLALADIENLPRSRLEEFDFLDLVRECQESVIERYPEALVYIEADESVSNAITGDRNLMRQALMNLMENAARYSPSPAQITVSLKWDNSDFTVAVADKGVGIPEGDLDYIFQRFFTVNKSKSQKLGGSGLGLSIVETIVEKHFGKVTVESRVGEGSRFTMFLHRDPFKA